MKMRQHRKYKINQIGWMLFNRRAEEPLSAWDDWFHGTLYM
jgi:hypothetical protein